MDEDQVYLGPASSCLRGAAEMTDQPIIVRIRSLEQAIETWATAHWLWFDAGFQSFAEPVDGEPGSDPVATILYSDGNLLRFIA
jgi:hypothetical protein